MIPVLARPVTGGHAWSGRLGLGRVSQSPGRKTLHQGQPRFGFGCRLRPEVPRCPTDSPPPTVVEFLCFDHRESPTGETGFVQSTSNLLRDGFRWTRANTLGKSFLQAFAGFLRRRPESLVSEVTKGPPGPVRLLRNCRDPALKISHSG